VCVCREVSGKKVEDVVLAGLLKQARAARFSWGFSSLRFREILR